MVTERDVNAAAAACAAAAVSTTVDATRIYQPLEGCSKGVDLYGDHPACAPPWEAAAICYRNTHGNVIVMATVSTDRPADARSQAWEPDSTDDKVIEWDRVRWTIEAPVFIGGRSAAAGGPFPTVGPVHLWRIAVYEDTSLADIRWAHLVPRHRMDLWDMAIVVLLGTLNYLNCRNVVLVDAARTRAERRRHARLGVEVLTLGVMPTGRSSRSGRPGGESAVPLHPVRGHPVHFGDCCPGRHPPKGLAFGRLTGMFWVPQYAAGTAGAGERRHNYELRPDARAQP